jgi:hypothetical protein
MAQSFHRQRYVTGKIIIATGMSMKTYAIAEAVAVLEADQAAVVLEAGQAFVQNCGYANHMVNARAALKKGYAMTRGTARQKKLSQRQKCRAAIIAQTG